MRLSILEIENSKVYIFSKAVFLFLKILLLNFNYANSIKKWEWFNMLRKQENEWEKVLGYREAKDKMVRKTGQMGKGEAVNWRTEN